MLEWIVDELKAELIAQRHVATGASLNSLRITELEEGSEWVITGNGSLYWVQYGRRPGAMPPLSAIRAWVAAIGLPQKAAYPIARSIAAKGTPGQPYVVWTEGNSLERKNFIARVIEKNKDRIAAEVGKTVEIRMFEKYKKDKIRIEI